MVKKRYTYLAALMLAGSTQSCSTYDIGGIFAAGSSVQERFRNSTELPDKALVPEKISSAKAEYAFLVATDLHIDSGDWGKLGRFMQTAADGTTLLTVLLGDYMHTAGSSLQRLADSIRIHKELRAFTTLGNHEVYKDGYQTAYRPAFGPTCYYFGAEIAGSQDLFIVLDSANGTLGNDQSAWLRGVLAAERTSYRHCFVFTHANFFSPPGYMDVISTYPTEEQMKLLDVFARNRVTAVFTGHSHVRDQTTVRGVRYVTVGAWHKGNRNGEYCRVECGADGKVGIGFRNAE